MPKVTKRQASKNDAPKRNSKDNQSLTEEEQPVITIVDKTDETKSKRGVKRKASVSAEKVNKFIYKIVFYLLFILEHKKSFNNR
jgi:hypothetical protein